MHNREIDFEDYVIWQQQEIINLMKKTQSPISGIGTEELVNKLDAIEAMINAIYEIVKLPPANENKKKVELEQNNFDSQSLTIVDDNENRKTLLSKFKKIV